MITPSLVICCPLFVLRTNLASDQFFHIAPSSLNFLTWSPNIRLKSEVVFSVYWLRGWAGLGERCWAKGPGENEIELAFIGQAGAASRGMQMQDCRVEQGAEAEALNLPVHLRFNPQLSWQAVGSDHRHGALDARGRNEVLMQCLLAQISWRGSGQIP